MNIVKEKIELLDFMKVIWLLEKAIIMGCRMSFDSVEIFQWFRFR